jgi:hypothetical protein
VADVEYRDGAAEGYLRHSSFKGLREDPLKADLTRCDLRRDPDACFVASCSHYSL